MDKKMNRIIGFRPEVQTATKKKQEKKAKVIETDSKPEAPPVIYVALSLQEQSNRLYKWLKNRPLINLNGVCKRAGMDRANFVKMAATGKELKPELLAKLLVELKPYGYAE